MQLKVNTLGSQFRRGSKPIELTPPSIRSIRLINGLNATAIIAINPSTKNSPAS